MDDSDNDGPNEQAFAVDENSGPELDPSVPPTSGTEYLRRVRKEAMGCPQTVVADLDTSAFLRHQTVKVSEPGGLLPVPQSYKAPLAWQELWVAQFASLRQKLCQFRALMKEKKISIPAAKLPHASQAQSWCKLCFGRLKVNQTLPVGSCEAASETSGAEDAESEGKPPLLHIVVHMDQLQVTSVLEYHVNWLEATGFSSRQGQWLYALLASLQKPLTPEICSWIRRLARLCSNIRASLESSDDPCLNELNLIICLVSRYFDQRDLADT